MKKILIINGHPDKESNCNALAEVSIYNEYDTLKEVIVGTANNLYFPASHDIEQEENATSIVKLLSKWIYPLLSGKKVPDWIAGKYRDEEDSLISVLQQYNVVVQRPDDVIPSPE